MTSKILVSTCKLISCLLILLLITVAVFGCSQSNQPTVPGVTPTPPGTSAAPSPTATSTQTGAGTTPPTPTTPATPPPPLTSIEPPINTATTISPPAPPTPTNTPAPTTLPPGYIKVTFSGQTQTFSPADIDNIPAVNVTAEGKNYSGPTVLSLINKAGVTDFAKITINGYSKGRVATAALTLDKSQLNDQLILRKTNQGTYSLASSNIASGDWIIDVNEIDVELPRLLISELMIPIFLVAPDWKVARGLAERLESLGLGKSLGVSRHQLLVDNRIRYTSHNSSKGLALCRYVRIF